MEILNNFSMIYCFISFVIGAFFMLAMMSIVAIGKYKEPSNNVHFYVAKDKDGSLWLYIGKPFRKDTTFNTRISGCYTKLNHRDGFKYFGLNEHNFDNLKWEDEPVEVFLNMEE